MLGIRQSKRTIRNGLTLLRDQIQDGGDAHWEWPRYIEPWNWKIIKQTFKELGLECFDLDGCTVGTKDPKTGGLLLKRWTIASSSKKMRQRLHLRCDGLHKHASILGGPAASTAYYPKPMCRRVVRTMLEPETWEEVAAFLEKTPNRAGSLCRRSRSRRRNKSGRNKTLSRRNNGKTHRPRKEGMGTTSTAPTSQIRSRTVPHHCEGPEGQRCHTRGGEVREVPEVSLMPRGTTLT